MAGGAAGRGVEKHGPRWTVLYDLDIAEENTPVTPKGGYVTFADWYRVGDAWLAPQSLYSHSPIGRAAVSKTAG